MKVLLAGEGVTELGDWSHHAGWRTGADSPGVLEALLACVGHFEVVDGIVWKAIHKFRAGHHGRGDGNSVLRAALIAREKKCDALVFVRDRDGSRVREEEIRAAAEEASANEPVLRIVGGVAAQQIEAWILAIHGDAHSEEHTDSKSVLEERQGHATRAAKVAAIEVHGIQSIPADAKTLRAWLTEAKALAGESLGSKASRAPK